MAASAAYSELLAPAAIGATAVATRRQHTLGSHDDLTAATEKRIGDRGEEQRIETGDGGEAGKLGVGHGARDRQRGDGDAGDEVVARVALWIIR